MDKKSKILIGVLSALCAVSLVVMIVFLVLPTIQPKFVPPEFEASAVQGEPTVDKQFDWQQIDPQGLNSKTGICGKPIIKDGKLLVYFYNNKDNNMWLRLRVLDKNGNTLCQTGIVKPDQCVESIDTLGAFKSGDEVIFKVMAYQPETYYSEGAFTLNTVVG